MSPGVRKAYSRESACTSAEIAPPELAAFDREFTKTTADLESRRMWWQDATCAQTSLEPNLDITVRLSDRTTLYRGGYAEHVFGAELGQPKTFVLDCGTPAPYFSPAPTAKARAIDFEVPVLQASATQQMATAASAPRPSLRSRAQQG